MGTTTVEFAKEPILLDCVVVSLAWIPYKERKPSRNMVIVLTVLRTYTPKTPALAPPDASTVKNTIIHCYIFIHGSICNLININPPHPIPNHPVPNHQIPNHPVPNHLISKDPLPNYPIQAIPRHQNHHFNGKPQSPRMAYLNQRHHLQNHPYHQS